MSNGWRGGGADALTAQGLHEIVGWSFEGPEQVARLRIADRPVVELENPMSTDQSRLRTTLLGSLLDVGQRNRARGAAALRLFEAGAVYLPDPEDSDPAHPLPSEPYHVAGLLTGPVRPPTWRDPEPRNADFFTAKGVLGAMLDTVHVPWSVEAAPEPPPFLHPGRSARVLIGEVAAGWVGEIHPDVAAGWDWSGVVAGFEIDLDIAGEHVRFTAYEDVTSFPEVREDLAVIVADTVTAAQVLDVVRGAGGALLAGAEVFDVYRDDQTVGAGHVSLALRLRFRARDRTLTDEEVATRRRKIAAALTAQHEGRVRDS